MTGKSSSVWRSPLALCILTLTAVVIIVSLLMLPWERWANTSSKAEVVVYAAQDQVYAEAVLKEFTRQTGVKARAVFDSEMVKTVGLANRLIAETNRPQADVFWGNEEMRTRQLLARGVFEGPKSVAAFGFRTRRIIINTNKLSQFDSDTVLSLRHLVNPKWKGKVALAYPLFGTTAAQFHVLRQQWGKEAWDKWCVALAANKPFLADGNSSVVNLVARGDAWIGLTDSDDYLVGKSKRYPISSLPITDETLMIPNTVAIVRGGPNPGPARQLFQFLQNPMVSGMLVEMGALDGTRAGPRPHAVVAWDSVLRDMEQTDERLKRIFLRR